MSETAEYDAHSLRPSAVRVGGRRGGTPTPLSPTWEPTAFDWARLGLMVAAVAFPIWAMRPLDFVKFGDIKYEYVMLVAVLTATLALLETAAEGGFGYRPSAWLWALGGVVALSLAASLVATDPVTAVNGNLIRRDGFLMVLANSMLFLAAYRLFQGGRAGRLAHVMAQTVVAAGLPVFVYALAQSLGRDPYVWEAFRGEGGRAFSTLGNPIFLGAYAAMVAMVAFGLWMGCGRSPWGWAWILSAGTATATMVLTSSRASWLGLAAGGAGLVVLAARHGYGRRCLCGLAGVALSAALLLGAVLLAAPEDRAATVRGSAATLTQPGDSRNSGRLAIWQISVRMIADHPLLGVGPDSMALHFEEYRTPAYDEAEGPDRVADKPHSSLLEWGVETGVPGAVVTSGLVAALLAATVWRLTSRRRLERSGEWIIAGVWAAALAYSVQSLITVTAIGVDGVWWVLLGTLAARLVPDGPGSDGGDDGRGWRCFSTPYPPVPIKRSIFID